jgi:ElaB/YqjD/DUF883 family membrane-anchored ribosome-binding protein
MAKGPDELERELELKRQQLHTRVDGLRRRATRDVRELQHETQEELSTVAHKVESQVSSHVWLAIAGSLGSGLALGLTAPRKSSRPKARPRKRRSGAKRNTKLVLQGIGLVADLASDQVKHEMRASVHSAATGILHRVTSRKRTPERKAA